MVVALVRVCGLKHAGLEVDGEAGWVVGAGQVVQRARFVLRRAQSGELLDGQHLALVGDGVHRVFVRVRGLEQPSLESNIL